MGDSSDWTCSCGRSNLRVCATCLACGKPRPAAGATPSSPLAPAIVPAPPPPPPPIVPAPAPAPVPDVVAPAPPVAPTPVAPAAPPERATKKRPGLGGPKCPSCGYENKPRALICSLCQAALNKPPTTRLGSGEQLLEVEDDDPSAPAPSPTPAAAVSPSARAPRAEAPRPPAATWTPPVRAASTARPDDQAGGLLRGCGCIVALIGGAWFAAHFAIVTSSGKPTQPLPVVAERVTDAIALAARTDVAHVRVGAGEPSWNDAVWRATSNGRSEFFPNDPRIATELGVDEIATRWKELRGTTVSLRGPTVPGSYYWEIDVRTSRHGNRSEIEKPTRIYAVLLGTRDAVWVVSEVMSSERDPRVKEFLTRKERKGKLVPALGAIPNAVVEKHGGLAQNAVALLEDAASFSDVQVWAPLGDGIAWVAVPEADRKPDVPLFLDGVWVPSSKRSAETWGANAPDALKRANGTLLTGALATAEMEGQKKNVVSPISGPALAALLGGLVLFGITFAARQMNR